MKIPAKGNQILQHNIRLQHVLIHGEKKTFHFCIFSPVNGLIPANGHFFFSILKISQYEWTLYFCSIKANKAAHTNVNIFIENVFIHIAKKVKKGKAEKI